ncbi:MAG: hypothetical protein AAFQ80_13395 [Cyanobacteria bacterium J06621_8]
MKIFKKAGVSVVIIAGVIGFKFHDKAMTAKAVQQEMISVCSVDQDCTDAVNTYFQSCFNASYSMGSRRRASSLDAERLADCINRNSGVAFFEI